MSVRMEPANTIERGARLKVGAKAAPVACLVTDTVEGAL